MLRKMNKKAFIPSVLSDIYSFLVFVLIILVFFFLFEFSAKPQTADISGRNDELNANMMLVNFLKTNIETEKKNITVSELIAKYKSEENENDKKLICDKLNEIDKNPHALLIDGNMRCGSGGEASPIGKKEAIALATIPSYGKTGRETTKVQLKLIKFGS